MSNVVKTDSLPAQRRSILDNAGAGLEETTADSFAIPFLTVLQKGSPQVDETSGKQLNGAKPGMIFETVSKQLIDGKEGCELVQAHFKLVWLRWGARDAGGGFKGEIAPEVMTEMKASRQVIQEKGMWLVADKNGEVDPDDSDRVMDTRIHYMLLLDRQKKSFKRCVLSLSRTQVRKSRTLMTRIGEYKAEFNGQQYTPATYQHVIRMTTVPEKNDQGTWYGVDFDLVDFTDDPDNWFYLAAETFKAQVQSGVAAAKMSGDSSED